MPDRQSQAIDYELPYGTGHSPQAASTWLYIGLFALVFAGIFSLLLVLAGTPLVQGVIPFIDFFHVSLMVHVTLSVLVWLLSMSAALWCPCRRPGTRYCARNPVTGPFVAALRQSLKSRRSW